MTTEYPKRWSLVKNNGVVNGAVFKTNLLNSCLGRKLSGRNNELIHVVFRGSNVVVLPD